MEDNCIFLRTYHLILGDSCESDENVINGSIDEGVQYKDDGSVAEDIENVISESTTLENVYYQWDEIDNEFPVLAVIEKNGVPIRSVVLHGAIDDIDSEIKRMRDRFEEFLKNFREAFEVNRRKDGSNE